jgi:diaminopimelate decarboxylase
LSLDKIILDKLTTQLESPFYVLDEAVVMNNYKRFFSALSTAYKNVAIAYSYKTNYTPHLCKLLHEQGAWAEVVSRMEYDMAQRNGIPADKILYNGPVKSFDNIAFCLAQGSVLHIDHPKEWQLVQKWVEREKPVSLGRVALRLNFEIEDQHHSRFGLSVETGEAQAVLDEVLSTASIQLVGLHCHFTTSARSVASFEERLHKLIDFAEAQQLHQLEFIDVGGGFFSEVPESLSKQFSVTPPSLEEYGRALSHVMAARYGEHGPRFVVEPGAAIAANTMSFVCSIWVMKQQQESQIAVCTGSMYNIKPTLHKLQMPYYRVGATEAPIVEAIPITGYTCKEDDVLIANYSGPLAEGDYFVFENVGAYSLVLKPPFIEPDFPLLSCNAEGEITKIRNRQTTDEILASYL